MTDEKTWWRNAPPQLVGRVFEVVNIRGEGGVFKLSIRVAETGEVKTENRQSSSG